MYQIDIKNILPFSDCRAKISHLGCWKSSRVVNFEKVVSKVSGGSVFFLLF